MQKYILFAIIAMLIYSIVPILYKKIPSINSVSLIFIFSIAGIIFSGLLLLIPGNAKFNFEGIVYAMMVGILINIGLLAYVSAVKLGNVSIATVIRNLSVAVTFILSIVFLSEKITLIKVLAGILGIAAIILFSL